MDATSTDGQWRDDWLTDDRLTGDWSMGDWSMGGWMDDWPMSETNHRIDSSTAFAKRRRHGIRRVHHRLRGYRLRRVHRETRHHPWLIMRSKPP
jgi:hypothetical protein